jgi:uncharacterized protein (DUF697 family)
MQLKPNAYELRQISEIEQWMNRSPGVISQFADSALSPISKLLSLFVPEKAILGALRFGNAAGESLARFQNIKQRAGIENYAELFNKELEFCDDLAQFEQNWVIGVAAAEGAAAGALGIPGLIIDIPAVIAQAMRAIHLMGRCYGFELESAEDRELAVGILSASGANSMKEKVAAILYLRTIQTTLARNTFKKMALQVSESAFSQQAVILGAKALAKQLGVNLTKRKMAQSIPFLGAGIATTINAWYLFDVCWAARRTFQERWMRQKGVLENEIGRLSREPQVIDTEVLPPQLIAAKHP